MALVVMAKMVWCPYHYKIHWPVSGEVMGTDTQKVASSNDFREGSREIVWGNRPYIRRRRGPDDDDWSDVSPALVYSQAVDQDAPL